MGWKQILGYHRVAFWMELGVILLFGCNSKAIPKDAQHAPPTPENRFGNDPELVADFNNLRSCLYRKNQLDFSCPELKTLQARLTVKRKKPSNRKKLVTTLTNLLESKREITRLVAANSLFFFHQEKAVSSALKAALKQERVPTIKATLIRQACWSMTPRVEKTALSLLSPKIDPTIRAEAVLCLGRHGKASEKVIATLRKLLVTDRSSRVRGNACSSLGVLKAASAVPELSKALDDPSISWRCSTSLAAMGNRPAYRAIVRSLQGILARGQKERDKQRAARLTNNERVSAQMVSALSSFYNKDFFDRSEAVRLLSRIAGQKELGWVARKRAVSELARLNGKQELQKLREVYGGGKLSNSDGIVSREIKRRLSLLTKK